MNYTNFLLLTSERNKYILFLLIYKRGIRLYHFKEKAQLVCVVYTMCGIVGVVGNTNATDILIQGLEKLEYPWL